MTAAEDGLLKVEPRFEPLIHEFGPCNIKRDDRGESIYESLLTSILSQQISTKAAASIKAKLYARFPDSPYPPAEEVAKMTAESLREVGISRQKASYILDLAYRIHEIPTAEQLDHMSDEEIIQSLIPIRGIGRWSVEMLLMFHMGRPDVLATDDLGLQEGMKRFLSLEERPNKKKMLESAEPWRPYRSTASWYLWRILQSPKEQPK
jgi:DNA-3-methyladenine glycosylase II